MTTDREEIGSTEPARLNQQTQQKPQQQQHKNSDAPVGIILPALKVGALTGTTGFITGGLFATLKSSPIPGLFALGTGFNCFVIGSTYWASRNSMLKLAPIWTPNVRIESPRDRIPVSGVAGALTGATAGLVLRGRANVIPGAIMWGLIGAGGQFLYAVADERHSVTVRHQPARDEEALKKGFWERAFRSEWSPVKRLTQEEYRQMLEEKLLGVEADIALVDEEIESIKKSSGGTSNS